MSFRTSPAAIVFVASASTRIIAAESTGAIIWNARE